MTRSTPPSDDASDTLERRLDIVVTQGSPGPAESYLLVVAGEEAGKLFPLNEREMSIGRSPRAHIRINEKAVSHFHARLQIEGIVSIQDLDSTNGTFVNNELIAGPVRLRGGDAVGIGSTTFTYLAGVERNDGASPVSLQDYERSVTAKAFGGPPDDSIFISYRRLDAGATAGRLADELKQRFGDRPVFFDTEGITPGTAYPGRIREALNLAQVALVVIGKEWLGAADEDRRRRIDDPLDWVHEEIATSLRRGIQVIPILVDGTTMPSRGALPPRLAPFSEFIAMPLEQAHFRRHAEQIIRLIDGLGLEERQLQAQPSQAPRSRPVSLRDMAGAPAAEARRRSSYALYPPELVAELETLTRSRHEGTPETKEQRQAQITKLATQLARNAATGDTVVGARLVSVIGKGNFGTVWHATDVSSGEPVAVKIFDTDRLGLGTALYHFRRGVRAMRHLEAIDGRPANIVKFRAAEPSGLAFSMTLLNGGDLSSIRDRGFSLEKKLELIVSICRAVQFAHQNGVIHRDIKPANIVMRDADAVLTDFDIADLMFAKTKSAQAAGTVHYSAPEALTGGGCHDPKVDVFSLGRLLYFLLRESDPPISFEDRPKLEDISGKYPELAGIIRKCTRTNPALRYPSVGLLLADLERQRLHAERARFENYLRPFSLGQRLENPLIRAALIVGGAILVGMVGLGIVRYGVQRSPSVDVPSATAEPVR